MCMASFSYESISLQINSFHVCVLYCSCQYLKMILTIQSQRTLVHHVPHYDNVYLIETQIAFCIFEYYFSIFVSLKSIEIIDD